MLTLSARSVGNGVGVTGTVKLYSEKGTAFFYQLFTLWHKITGLTLGVRCFELYVRRNNLVFQGQDRFDQAGYPRSTFRMTQVGFDRADVHAFVPEHLPNCSCFNWVTLSSSGTMALEFHYVSKSAHHPMRCIL